MRGSWQDWSCLGGENAGESCTPGRDECGDRSQCTTAGTVHRCLHRLPTRTAEMARRGRLLWSNGSEAEPRDSAGVKLSRGLPGPPYLSTIPIKGFILWDSHAFNLTKAGHLRRAVDESRPSRLPTNRSTRVSDLRWEESPRDGTHRRLHVEGSVHVVHTPSVCAALTSTSAHASVWQAVPRLVSAQRNLLGQRRHDPNCMPPAAKRTTSALTTPIRCTNVSPARRS